MNIPSIFGLPWMTTLGKAVQENKNWKAFGTEILGSNVPKMAIVRTWNESLDIGFNDVGNTIGFFGGLVGISKLADAALKRLKIPINPNPKFLSQGRVFKSFALIPPLFAWMWATAFLRNAVTVWRSGSTDFRHLITHRRDTRDTPELRAKRREMVRKNLNITAAILGTGIATAMIGTFLTLTKGRLRLFEGGKLRPGLQWAEKAVKLLCLRGAKGNEYEGLWAVAYWIMPGNMGFITSARDHFEFKEQMLKMANFALWYPIVPKVVNKVLYSKTLELAKQFPKAYNGTTFLYKEALKLEKGLAGPALKQLKNVIRFENMRFFADNALTIAMLNVTPSLINIYLTKQRMARADAQAAAYKKCPPPLAKPQSQPILQTSAAPVWYYQAPQNQTFMPYSMPYQPPSNA